MKVGTTSTIPVEVPLAAGHTVIDLNNIFITDPDPARLIALSNAQGIPSGLCGWIRGIYPLARDCDEIVVVSAGDCTNLIAMGEICESEGTKVTWFDYPFSRSHDDLARSIGRFADHYGVSMDKVERVKARLDGIRRKVDAIDTATWEAMTVTGSENNIYNVSTTDFDGDADRFENKVDNFLAEIQDRPGSSGLVRLAFIGVPPIITDIYDVIETMGARVVYNEVQREFAMPAPTGNIVDQYINYTYPYRVEGRRAVIERELARRSIDGIILYHERFCYKNLNSAYFSRHLSLPTIEIEGSDPARTDERTRIRLETFIEMVRERNR